MKNFERYRGKELQKVVSGFLKSENGLDDIHRLNQNDWARFGLWLFYDATFKFKIEYKVSNVPYLQEFILDATDPIDAKEKFLEFMAQNKFSVRIVRVSSGGEE